MQKASIVGVIHKDNKMTTTIQHDDLPGLNRYQRGVLAMLALTQFTVVLDFMVMSPLGDMMMKSLSITPRQFAIALSAYAFSAGVSGLLTAGFADQYDRKRMLLFFYAGFLVGTVCCAFAPNFELLVAARIVTGLFGGVMGSITMAITADLFLPHQRGRVMGLIQTAFGVSQLLGIPIGLYIANHFGWHMPFLWIAAMEAGSMVLIAWWFQPIRDHLALQKKQSAFKHLWQTLAVADYRKGFVMTAMLSLGGFMMMPFSSAFAMNNLALTAEQLPLLFLGSGLAAVIVMPLVGRLSDRYNKWHVFIVASILAMIFLNIYARFGPMPFWIVLVTNVVMMSAIMSRMVPSMAMVSSIPQAKDRGAFMSLNSSLQQIAGGFGSVLAGLIIVQKDSHAPLEHYDTLALICAVFMVVTIYLLYRVSQISSVHLKTVP
jgi:predicted MFS family arabinose efflux permease